MQDFKDIERYSFDDYVPTDSNRFAYSVALAVSQYPGLIYNPLVIYGNSGLGKSHLLQAIVKAIKKKYPEKKIVHVTGEKFTNDLVESIKKGKEKGNVSSRKIFKKQYREIDILIVDDIQFIKGKKATQSEFLHVFDALFMAQKQVILSSDIPPKQMRELNEGLQSRFMSGIVANLSYPNESDRQLIAKHIVKRLGYEVVISREDIKFIAKNIKKNIRSIEGAIMTLAAVRLLEPRKNNVDILPEVILKDLLNEEKSSLITYDRILEVVGIYYNVTVSELKGKNRSVNIVMARHVAMYLMNNMVENTSISQIALVMSKNHSSVIYALNQIESLMNTDNALVNTIQVLREEIRT